MPRGGKDGVHQSFVSVASLFLKVTLQDSWVRLLPDSKPVLPDLPLRSLRYSFLRRGRRDERHPHAVVEGTRQKKAQT